MVKLVNGDRRLNISPKSSLGFQFKSSMNRRNLQLASSSKNDRDNEDRISNLSDHILHHILSFLNMEKAVQTSVLSRRWRFLWCSLPFLKFDFNLYLSRKNSDSLTSFVDQVLHQRDNSNIQCFKLLFASENHLSSWILYALRFNVQDLRLLVTVDGELWWLPHRLFVCTSLTVLKLNHWDARNVCVKLSLPDSISLPVLRKLCIQCISFEGDDDDLVNKFFSSCPLLESLSIRYCEFRSNNLNISSLELKHLKIERYHDQDDDFKRNDNGSVKVYAPNLLSFRCKDFLLKSYSLGDFPSLVKADIDMAIDEKEYPGYSTMLKEVFVRDMMKIMKAVQNVKSLMVSGSVPQILSRAYVLEQSNSAQFCNLRYLKLVTRLSMDCIHGITYLLKICPNVETLMIWVPMDFNHPLCDKINFDSANMEDDSEGDLSTEWSLHHLKFVEFRWIVGSVNELKFLQVVLKHSLVLKKLLIATYQTMPGKEKLLTKFREKLLTFPIASPRIAILFD